MRSPVSNELEVFLLVAIATSPVMVIKRGVLVPATQYAPESIQYNANTTGAYILSM